MDWISFDGQRPSDSQRCLVCFKPYQQVIILTYNEHYDCWDDNDGDDYYCDLDEVDFWRPLPYYKSCN